MRSRATSMLAALVAAGGALECLRAVTGHGQRGLGALAGVALFVLARGLAGRRRLAGQVLVAAAAVAALLALRDHRAIAVACAVAALAVHLLRDGFPTRPDPHRVRAATALAGGVAGLAAAETVWHIAVDHQRPATAGLAAVAAGPGAGSAAVHVTAALVALGLIAALAVLLAPAPAPPPGSPDERARVAVLASWPGADSLAPFATRADRTYAFSPDGAAAIGYRVLHGTALAGGDPVGDPGSGAAAVTAFLDECTRRGWRPAVLGSGDDWLPRWRDRGMRGLPIGDEAVLPLETFSLESRRMRNVRQAAQRTRNAGVTVRIGPLDELLAEELAPVLREWLGGSAERGYAMNLDAILTPRPDCLVAVARDAEGVPLAFARFAVCGGGRIVTLDVAPRRRPAPNGVVERLIIETAEYARQRGADEVSLNFAGFRSVFESPRPAARAVAATLHAFDRWIELAPLYRFTAKFRPHWRTRHLLLRSWWELGWVALAALRAEFGARPAAPRPAEDEPGAQVAWSRPR